MSILTGELMESLEKKLSIRLPDRGWVTLAAKSSILYCTRAPLEAKPGPLCARISATLTAKA